ncbi:MAG: di-trans,poly-cis-decaprenylcistransferase [Dehalococcoidia bacterium]|nr:di-trans,poly-cis-decaprenylcistransferase [Dehalococcoidia bacterium]
MALEQRFVAPALPQISPLPQHVAVIMDGNGRWAQQRSLARHRGHRAGAENIRHVVERFTAHGVPMLTVFAFSTENWGRPRAEVDAILRLGSEFIDRHLGELDRQGVRLQHIGDADRLPRALQSRVRKAVEQTRENDRITLNIAFNYGGRADIVNAVRTLMREGARPEDVTEETIAARLATANLPEPDLLIRTGGERRISNFLVWQAAYTEYHFSSALWPDFGPADIDAALEEYSQRRRRFGLIPGGVDASGTLVALEAGGDD